MPGGGLGDLGLFTPKYCLPGRKYSVYLISRAGEADKIIIIVGQSAPSREDANG